MREASAQLGYEPSSAVSRLLGLAIGDEVADLYKFSVKRRVRPSYIFPEGFDDAPIEVPFRERIFALLEIG